MGAGSHHPSSPSPTRAGVLGIVRMIGTPGNARSYTSIGTPATRATTVWLVLYHSAQLVEGRMDPLRLDGENHDTLPVDPLSDIRQHPTVSDLTQFICPWLMCLHQGDGRWHPIQR